jgi:hypothetical protein
MISAISLKNFKSIKEADLKLGPFNLFIGTNASGKSNFFDSLRFLQGVGWGLSIDEILNGRPRTGTGSEWDGVRGGSTFLQWSDPAAETTRANPVWVEATIKPPSESRHAPTFRYGIGINTVRNSVRGEFLEGGWRGSWDSRQVENDLNSPVVTVKYRSRARGKKPHYDYEKHRPVIQQIQRDRRIAVTDRFRAQTILTALRNTQRLDPQPDVLRKYATSLEVDRMGEHGENFPALIQQICSDETRKEGYLGWLRELRPSELDDVTVLSGALREPLFALIEKGRTFPAPVLSDGTLRFAAITAAFFQPSMPQVLMLEEIENGVHAGRLRLLVELLKSRAGASQTQVLATSHSALMLDWLSESDYQFVFLCNRDSDTGVTTIVPLTEIPHFAEAIKTTPASQLISEGWLETAL